MNMIRLILFTVVSTFSLASVGQEVSISGMILCKSSDEKRFITVTEKVKAVRSPNGSLAYDPNSYEVSFMYYIEPGNPKMLPYGKDSKAAPLKKKPAVEFQGRFGQNSFGEAQKDIVTLTLSSKTRASIYNLGVEGQLVDSEAILRVESPASEGRPNASEAIEVKMTCTLQLGNLAN